MVISDDASRIARDLRTAEVDPTTLRVIEGGAMAATLVRAGFPPAWIAERFGCSRTAVLYRIGRFEAARAKLAQS